MPARPSPFPGMDPYLERRWGDVRGRLIGYAADDLTPRLPADLVARQAEQVYIDAGAARPVRVPDVTVAEQPPVPWSVARPVAGGVDVAEPVLLVDPGPVVERSIRIVDLTAIEFLSPRNKLTAGGGRAAYLRKRRELLASDAHLVEVDLVRAGNWLAMMAPYRVASADRTAYRVTVSRATPDGEPLALYPIRLDGRLPVIPIPLRPGEPDVPLALQALVDRAYDLGRYGSIDYAADCDPPLAGADADWADRLLRAAGRRV